MDGSAVNEIEALALKGLELRKVDGKTYSTIKLSRVYSDPRPDVVKVRSLTGLADFLKANIDKLEMDRLVIHIVDHATVVVRTDVHGEQNERHSVVSAELETLDRFPFDKFIGQEQFIIKLKSMFEKTEDQEAILKYTSKIDSEAAVITADDGVTQNVNIKQGVTGVRSERQNIPSLVKLRPYRTFTEIAQPETEFLFRMKTGDGGATCALFDADGGAWKNKARQSIGDFFKVQDLGLPVIA